MYLMIKLSLIVNNEIEKDLLDYEKNFKSEVGRIHDIFLKEHKTYEYRYKDISNRISYNSKHLVLAEAKNWFNEKEETPFRFCYSSYWSNSSYWIKENLILELGLSDRKRKLYVPFYQNEQQLKRLKMGKPMNLQIVHSHQKWYAVIYLQLQERRIYSKKQMGIDIGIKVPAVVATSEGKVRFFGNGREIRYRQRQLRGHIKKLQKMKQYKKLIAFKHKLSHVLTNYDHQISRQIVDFAVKENIGVIKMEKLTRINRRFNVRKCENIYLGSYRRLQEFIEYKAELEGIEVRYINPYMTSQKCPKCGKINHADDRDYHCSCGYHAHRDVVGALNILQTL